MAVYQDAPIDQAYHALSALSAVRDLVGETDIVPANGDNLAMLLRLIEEKLDGALDGLAHKPNPVHLVK